MTQAEVLAWAGSLKEAAAAAEKACGTERGPPAREGPRRACWGDIPPRHRTPDYRQAIQYHSQAVQAEPLAVSKHPAVRVAAKEVMLDAHLGAAHDIAWGTCA